MPKPRNRARALYIMLAVYILVSMAYYVVNLSGFVDDFFDFHHRPEMPFELLALLALLLFGIYFPERWRLDRNHPWIKWVWIVPAFVAIGISIGILIGLAWGVTAHSSNDWNNPNLGAIGMACIVLYLLAIFDKSRSASTADARRRLQVLGVGSVIGLGSLAVYFGLLPLLHIDIERRAVRNTAAIIFLVLPLSLVYAVVVQRAIDLRILLRTGTKYALARATLAAIRTCLLVGLAASLVLVIRAPAVTTRAVVAIAVFGALLWLLRSRFTRKLSVWLDRKFFREAYDAEQLLLELSHRVRKSNDSEPMLRMVSESLAETLQIDKIAVLLRGGNALHLQQAVGLDLGGFANGNPVYLPLNSATVRNLMRINTPVSLYRERPDGWLLLASQSERRLLDAMSAELLLPLPGREQLMGLITLGRKRSEEPYTSTDLQLLESVATQTGLALEIGNLARSLAAAATQQERIDREMEVAREVQERLFPQEFPAIDGVSLAGHCRPAQGVGGDYYDLFTLGDGRMGFAIGDVSGKGISAALLMASLRASLRSMTLDDPHDLAVMMGRVNRLVYESSASNRYATFFFATYNGATRELVYVNAGHNAPFLIRRMQEGFQVHRLEVGGPVVGLLPSAVYQEERVTLAPGDLLLAYTDGISEAMTEAEEEWGEERMLTAAQAVPDGTAQQVLEHLLTEADRFTLKAAQYDDMTLLALKLEAALEEAALEVVA